MPYLYLGQWGHFHKIFDSYYIYDFSQDVNSQYYDVLFIVSYWTTTLNCHVCYLDWNHVYVKNRIGTVIEHAADLETWTVINI